MNRKDYIDTLAPSPAWLNAIQAEAKRKGLDQLKMRDINRLIADVRRSPAKKTAKRSRP